MVTTTQLRNEVVTLGSTPAAAKLATATHAFSNRTGRRMFSKKYSGSVAVPCCLPKVADSRGHLWGAWLTTPSASCKNLARTSSTWGL